jgi:hypothetical protein
MRLTFFCLKFMRLGPDACYFWFCLATRVLVIVFLFETQVQARGGDLMKNKQAPLDFELQSWRPDLNGVNNGAAHGQVTAAAPGRQTTQAGQEQPDQVLHVGGRFLLRDQLPFLLGNVRFRRVQTLVREGSPLVKLRNADVIALLRAENDRLRQMAGLLSAETEYMRRSLLPTKSADWRPAVR